MPRDHISTAFEKAVEAHVDPVTTHTVVAQIETAVDSKLAAIPPVVVSGVTFLGMELQQWAYIVTISYTLLLIGGQIWRWYRIWKGKK